MRGGFFIFIVLCIMMIFIGNCSKADEVTHKERLVEICGKIPGLPSVKPVTDQTFDKLGRYRVEATDWMTCGHKNAETPRDHKLLTIVRYTSDRWTLSGLQEIQRAKSEPIQPLLPSFDIFEQW